MKIGIIGVGYVGLVTAVCLAAKGNFVVACDTDRQKIRALQKGRVPFYEPDVSPLLNAVCNEGRLRFTDTLKDVLSFSEIVFLCVGTPSKKTGQADMSHFYKAIAEVKDFANQNKDRAFIVVNKSTAPVGTAREVHKRLGERFAVVSNPEFLREGKAVADFMKPDRIVVGLEDTDVSDSRARKRMSELYAPFDCPKITTDWETAELIKYASNAYLATKISFINEIAALSERVGADVKTIAEGMGHDPRIGKEFLRAGVGYGGSCFPKDIRALHYLSRGKRYRFKLLKAVIEVNNQQRLLAVEKIMSALPKGRGKRVAVLGLSFKPETDDVRESASIAVIKELHDRGVQISAYDPKAAANARRELKSLRGVRIAGSAEDALQRADAVFLATEWHEFLRLDWKKAKRLMRGDAIIDGRNVLNQKELIRFGFRYQGFGVFFQ